MAPTDIAYRTAQGHFANQLDDIILPRWMGDEPWLDPANHTIDCTPYSGAGPLHENAEFVGRMRVMFHDVGLVHLINTGLFDLADQRLAAKIVLEAEMTYDGGANPRDSIEPNVYEVGAPLTAHLHYHHEMAYVRQSTRMLGFLAKRILPGRGASFVSDNIAATDAILKTEFGKKLADKGVCYHRLLTDRDAYAGRLEEGVYNHWQKSLGTEDPDEAVERANATGLTTEWDAHRLLRTKFYVSAFEYFPQLDRNLLYSSVADHGMWFDAWPLVMHLPYEQRPLHLTFGDDTEISKDELRQFVAVYDAFGTHLDWRQGDVAVVCNYRFAHGRPGIHLRPGEDRQLGVLLGEKFDRVGSR